MEDRRYQKELFEFEKPKRSFPRFGRIFIRSNVAITLTMEKLVFISIGLIMLMVIIYALGVEKGKVKSSPVSVTQPVIRSRIMQPAATPIVQNRVISTVPIEAKPVQPIQEPGMPYTIVAVTFIRKDTALAEINRLKKEGFDAFITQSDSYFLVCIGSYPDKGSAQSKKALSKIRQIYKDAYFKLK